MKTLKITLNTNTTDDAGMHARCRDILAINGYLEAGHVPCVVRQDCLSHTADH